MARNVFDKRACLSGMQCIALYEQPHVTDFRRLIKCMTSFPIFYVHSAHGRCFHSSFRSE